MDNERTLKQNYLRTEIMEKGFDSEQFLGYISDLKGEEEAEIDNFTLEELKEAVANFKIKLNKEQNNNIPQQRTTNQEIKNDNSTVMTSATKAEVIDNEDSGPVPKDVNFIINL